ncbi:uncharacterized protein LOC123654930 [Melitaea cinxia]|uniref:uncharacterized protein LOC123654930 n=1 Tax=Melitaea cinxia TaxID=113334 RepID=UPI001E271832|nr:uncharacterized protein LOC123654930 [Melitaea cinxia]
MTLKCNSCNIVISELLAYVQNKLSVADEDSIVRICASTFSSEQIEDAKNLLVNSLPADQRKTTRKGKGKENRSMNDIIGLFKVTDPDVLPIFVARDLDKLPPITFDHLDVSKLLKDLAVVQADIKNIKSSYVTVDQLEELKRECQHFKQTSPPFSAVKVNMRRGAYRDSGPIGLSQFDDTIITNQSQHLNGEPSSPKDCNLNYRCINFMEGNYKSQVTVGSVVSAGEGARVAEQVIGAVAGAGRPSIASSPTPAPTEPRASPPASSGAASKQAAGAIARSFAEVASAEGEWRVVRRGQKQTRYRYTGAAGVSNEESNFKAADRKVPIFITMIHRDTTENDIVQYVYDKTREKIILEKISFSKENKDYNAYKFFVSERKIDIFLDKTL